MFASALPLRNFFADELRESRVCKELHFLLLLKLQSSRVRFLQLSAFVLTRLRQRLLPRFSHLGSIHRGDLLSDSTVDFFDIFDGDAVALEQLSFFVFAGLGEGAFPRLLLLRIGG